MELREFELQAPRPGRAIVRVRNCGICGSDLHFYHGAFSPPRDLALGHEISGQVVELGEGATGVAVGDRIVVEPVFVCRRCSYCLSGDRQLCAERQLMGSAVDGGLAEYVEVPDYTLHGLPDSVPFHVGALAEPVAVCVHGLRIVDLQAEETVLILGAGTIGLLSVVVARELGASTVAVTARHPHQATLARQLGATEVFDDGPEGARRLSAFAATKPFDVVVETVGGEADTLATAVSSVRPGGRVSVLGVFTKPVALHPVLMILKEVRIVGALTYCSRGDKSDFQLAIEILERRWSGLESLITSRFPLEDVASAFERAADKSMGGIKVTVEPLP